MRGVTKVRLPQLTGRRATQGTTSAPFGQAGTGSAQATTPDPCAGDFAVLAGTQCVHAGAEQVEAGG